MSIKAFFRLLWGYWFSDHGSVIGPGNCDHDDDKDPNIVQWALSGDYDPNKPILIDAAEPNHSLSKRQVTELVTRLAGSFQPGSVVCLHLANSILYPVLVLSILAGECRWTGTNPTYTSAELQHHLDVSGAQYVITAADHRETVKAGILGVKRDIEIIIVSDIVRQNSNFTVQSSGYRTLHQLLSPPDSPAAIPLKSRLENIHAGAVATLMSTSGTTGLPKMAQRTHRAIVAESRSDERYDSTKPYTIRGLYCTPMFHAYSFPKMVINPLRQGQPTYYMARFDESFACRVAQYQITDTITVPPILSRLVEQARKGAIPQDALRSLRSVICAGASMTAELRTEFLEAFDLQACSLVQEWGMTECGCITRQPYLESDPTGTVGSPVGGYQVRVDTEQTIQCRDGRIVGELLAWGPQLMTGYLGNEIDTAQAFAEGGWYRTGDVGYVHGDTGRVYLMDRVKDIIKTNGWQISPAELEAAVLRLPGVAEACALSMGHSLNEHPQIFVVREKENITEGQIKEHMRAYLARYKIDSCAVSFINTLPRAPSGKVLRRILRTQLLKETDRDS
ncbi:uncharacterized protein BDW70DRAFT_10377 [Aspergillus foveolatus]|uniref:uncharacterized protein n=1 Tax=Aspergillus foveolatus TaxID=210207 RepID=UPI003CCD5316